MNTQEILAIKVEDLEQRCPIYIGSRFEVEKAMEFLAAKPGGKAAEASSIER